MPTYEYACSTCGEHLEIVQSFRDEPLTVCPACGGPLRKVFGSIGVVFKGSGFYKTDSRPGKGAKERSGTAAKAGSESSASSDSSAAGSGSTGTASSDSSSSTSSGSSSSSSAGSSGNTSSSSTAAAAS